PEVMPHPPPHRTAAIVTPPHAVVAHVRPKPVDPIEKASSTSVRRVAAPALVVATPVVHRSRRVAEPSERQIKDATVAAQRPRRSRRTTRPGTFAAAPEGGQPVSPQPPPRASQPAAGADRPARDSGSSGPSEAVEAVSPPAVTGEALTPSETKDGGSGVRES